jgi:hypothetical protein
VAIALVSQDANTSSTPSGSSAAITCTSTTAGNLLVLTIHLQSSSATITAVTDSSGPAAGTWQKAVDLSTSGSYTGIWYRENVPAGITSVTATQSTGISYCGVVSQWSSVATASSLRTTNFTNVATSPNRTGAVTAVAGDLAIGAISANSATTRTLQAPFTGFTQGVIPSSFTGQEAYDLPSTGGSLEAQWTTASAANTGGVIAVFMPAAGAAAAVPPGPTQRPRPRMPRPPRGRVAAPVPPQIVTAPAWVPQTTRPRPRFLRAFRGRTATPPPAQVALVPPAYPPRPARGRVRGLRLFRPRAAAPVPAQIAPVGPSGVPAAVRTRLKGLLRRPARVAVPPADRPLVAGSPRTRPRMPAPRRGRVAAVPLEQAGTPPPRPARPRLKGLRLTRGRTAKPAPAQVVVTAPPIVPAVTRIRRRLASLVRGLVATPVPPPAVCDPVTHRPDLGHTARSSSGLTTRPGTGTTPPGVMGTTARPDSGTTTRPSSCSN